jgi:hypothetical protein
LSLRPDNLRVNWAVGTTIELLHRIWRVADDRKKNGDLYWILGFAGRFLRECDLAHIGQQAGHGK